MLSFLRIEHRDAASGRRYRHLTLQHVPMFDQPAALDAEEIDHHLGDVRPAESD